MYRPSAESKLAWLPGGLGALLCLLALWFLLPQRGDRLEFLVYDRVARATIAAASPLVEVVAIDDASLDDLGPWPWPSDLHARLIDRLHAAGARVIAFTVPVALTNAATGREDDIPAAASDRDASTAARTEWLRELLTRSALHPEHVARLVEAAARHGNVVLAMRGRAAADVPDVPTSASPWGPGLDLSDDARARIPTAQLLHSQPEALLAAATAVGFLDASADHDGIMRSAPALVRTGSGLMLGLSAATALRARSATAEPRLIGTRTLDLDGLNVPLDRSLRLRPAFAGAGSDSSIGVTPYRDVLIGVADQERFHDKIVIVGPVATRLAAPTATPVAADLPDTLVVAETVASLLDGRLVAQPMWALVLELLAGMGAVGLAALVLPRLRWHVALAAAAALAASMLLFEIGLLAWLASWVQLTVPTVTLLAAAVLVVATREAPRLLNRTGDSATLEGLRLLGLSFQQQGQLELAFETFRKCPVDSQTLDLLYGLGRDFERRSQTGEAAAVYGYVSVHDARFRDVSLRLQRCRGAIPAIAEASNHLPAPEPQSEHPPVVSSTPGFRLGRYEIERELGRGAMGTVYVGRDPNINRVVAIKAIRLADEFDGDALIEARARFFREAEMAGRLSHPGIVTVYDAGEDEGLAFIAMEYLRGRHLSHYADPLRLLPVGKVLLLGARIADALAFAHRQNVIHRDIKPANIMFNAETDELKITDFGIARLTDSSRTRTGIVLGTPSFMSPEQLEGRILDGRSDLFALGTSLYQLLTGWLPFLADSMPSLMLKIANEPHAPAVTLRPELPRCVDGMLSRALAKDPADRFQSAAEMAAALRSCAGSAGA